MKKTLLYALSLVLILAILPSTLAAEFLTPDEDGYLYLEQFSEPFTFAMAEASAVLFTTEQSGEYSLTNDSHDTCESLFVIYDLNAWGNEEGEVGMNWPLMVAEASIPSMVLESGGLYMLMISPLDTNNIGSTVQFSFAPAGILESPPEPIYEMAYDANESITWNTTAEEWRGDIGKRIQVTLPPGGSQSKIWGTAVYTDDSPIGTAAVHAGLINFQDGGTVIIEIVEPQDSYKASNNNDIASNDYGKWEGSYRFTLAAPKVTAIPYDTTAAGDWKTTAEKWRGETGKRIKVTIPAGGSVNSIWGTEIYTDDSPIAVAAVHAGLITLENGGTVIIEIMDPLDSYTGSRNNGVSSSGYGAWHGSYRFITSDR